MMKTFSPELRTAAEWGKKQAKQAEQSKGKIKNDKQMVDLMMQCCKENCKVRQQ